MNYWNGVYTNTTYYFGDYDNPARKMLLKIIKDGESLLDLGSGNGMTYDFLTKNNRQIFYTGYEYSQKALDNCKTRFPGVHCFEKFDIRDLSKIEDNKFDTVYFRHVLENCHDWQEAIKQAFRIAKKRVVIDMRRTLVDSESRLLEDKDDTVCWDISYDEFNHLARTLSVSVSYLQESLGDSNTFVVINKLMDDVVFTLDDFHADNHQIETLLGLKEKYSDFKVTLFTIPSKSPRKWLNKLKELYGDWMQFAVHGWFHDVNNYPNEVSHWEKEEALKYLSLAEDMGCFVKGFKAPGWQMSVGTYEALKEKDYWIMDHELYKHLRPSNFTKYYETGHLWEVNGHVQETPYNGLQNIINNKLNFHPGTRFHFVNDMVGSEKDQERLCHYRDQILTQQS